MTDPLAQETLESALSNALPRLRRHLAARQARARGVDLEDVLQEVCARALRYRTSFDPEREFWPWLRRVADRALSDQRAAGARKPAPLDELDPAAPEVAEPLELRDELDRLLTQLPAGEREILVRFHEKEQSIKQIAADLGLPEGTVKSHLFRARKRLARLGGWVASIALLSGLGFVLWKSVGTQDGPEPGRSAELEMTINHETTSPALERVILEPRRVLGWTIEGETP